jgi:hypothetical protein
LSRNTAIFGLRLVQLPLGAREGAPLSAPQRGQLGQLGQLGQERIRSGETVCHSLLGLRQPVAQACDLGLS